MGGLQSRGGGKGRGWLKRAGGCLRIDRDDGADMF